MSFRSILLVDDDPSASELLRHLLAKAGFKGALKTVNSAPAALHFIDEAMAAGSAPEFILVDLSMPEMHGLDLVREIRRRLDGEATFVAVVSGSVDDADIHGAFSVGADAYLEKFPSVENLAIVHDAVVNGVRRPGTMCMLRRKR